MKVSCQVVFPLYRKPTALELAFLEHGVKTLGGFEMVIVCPQSLIVNAQFGTLASLPLVRFSDHYFADISGYNKLLLSAEFYEAFSKFEYILIHQADVYIFRNELQFWCDSGYSYIGPPWFRPADKPLKRLFNRLRRIVQPGYGLKHNLVGNGGFSLRSISAALSVLSKAPETLMDRYRTEDHHLYNEDVFWSLEAPKIDSDFLIPPLEKALQFGVEFQPELAVERIGRLPFGCHAPLVHGKHFWSAHIPALKD